MPLFYSQNTRIVHYIWKLKKQTSYGAIVLLLAGIMALSFSSFKGTNPTCKYLITQMLYSIDNVKTLEFHLNLNERIKGKIVTNHSSTKLNKSPRKIYI